MTPAVVLLALLCPLGAGAADCTSDTSRIVIAHPAPAGTACGTALMQLQMEIAGAAEQPGPGEGWQFRCHEEKTR